MKNTIIALLLIFIVAMFTTVYADEVYDISIEMIIGQNESTVNGKVVCIDENKQVAPFIENGRTLVPLRFVADSLGLEVQWMHDTQSVILTNENTEIILSIGNENAFVNGSLYELDSYPVLKNERTFVPVRFICEALQCEVNWDEGSQKVMVLREKETEIDINSEEVQALFKNVLNQKEFASYYAGYCDNAIFDNPENMFGGTMRELFSFLCFEKFEEKQYTNDEAKAIILDFLSKGDTSKSISSPGIDSLKYGLEQGYNYGSDSKHEILVAVYDGKVFDEISVDLFGAPLPKHENLAYAIGYHTFHLFNRVNLYYPFAKTNLYNVYYNEASDQYLFTRYVEQYMNFEDEEAPDSDTKLVKATMHNGKISLYIQRYTEYEEYSGETSTYDGVYKNTYQKSDNGYYWISSYGMDKSKE